MHSYQFKNGMKLEKVLQHKHSENESSIFTKRKSSCWTYSDVNILDESSCWTYLKLQSLEKRQEKQHILIIGVDSYFIQVWDVVLLSFVLYESVATPLDIAFAIEDSNSGIKRTNTIADVLFIFDLAMSFFKAFIDTNGDLITDLSRIQQRYMKFWFWIDFPASIPLSWFGVTSISALGLIKSLRLLRIGRLLKYVAVLPSILSFK
jgi:hypothetical protein